MNRLDDVHKQTDWLMEWAEEVANKCGRSSTYIIAQFCYTNNTLKDLVIFPSLPYKEYV